MDKVPDKFIERGVELWCRELRKPEFNNGSNNFLVNAMAFLNIKQDRDNTPDMETRIEVFRVALTENLKKKKDGEECFYCWLSTDYAPNRILAEAAEEAGIPKSQFSCKSSVCIENTHVSASFGYGAKTINHYPLPNGDWLITDLCGDSDMEKIFKHVENGNKIGFQVEKAEKSIQRIIPEPDEKTIAKARELLKNAEGDQGETLEQNSVASPPLATQEMSETLEQSDGDEFDKGFDEELNNVEGRG